MTHTSLSFVQCLTKEEARLIIPCASRGPCTSQEPWDRNSLSFFIYGMGTPNRYPTSPCYYLELAGLGLVPLFLKKRL